MSRGTKSRPTLPTSHAQHVDRSPSGRRSNRPKPVFPVSSSGNARCLRALRIPLLAHVQSRSRTSDPRCRASGAARSARDRAENRRPVNSTMGMPEVVRAAQRFAASLRRPPTGGRLLVPAPCRAPRFGRRRPSLVPAAAFDWARRLTIHSEAHQRLATATDASAPASLTTPPCRPPARFALHRSITPPPPRDLVPRARATDYHPASRRRSSLRRARSHALRALASSRADPTSPAPTPRT